jgi:hypothetical protein
MNGQNNTSASSTSADSKKRARPTRGIIAIFQAKLVLMVMINLAQLWILAATIEAALARHYKELIPLAVASGVCWLISLSIIFWWKPVTRR